VIKILYFNILARLLRKYEKFNNQKIYHPIGIAMKICPRCEAENEDQYIYCIGCHKPLPKQSRMDNLMSQAVHEMKNRNFRKAVVHLDAMLKLNVGDKEAWLLKGIALSNLGAGGEARECFKSSGVMIRERTCQDCIGSGKCMSCNQTGVCYMCKGRRRCPMCGGSGDCHHCGGIGCKVCKDTGHCVRCKGSRECIYCESSGVCPDCRGLKSCGICGGTGRALQIQVESVPSSMRKYLKLKR
jgi:hypothetical protein